MVYEVRLSIANGEIFLCDSHAGEEDQFLVVAVCGCTSLSVPRHAIINWGNKILLSPSIWWWKLCGHYKAIHWIYCDVVYVQLRRHTHTFMRKKIVARPGVYMHKMEQCLRNEGTIYSFYFMIRSCCSCHDKCKFVVCHRHVWCILIGLLSQMYLFCLKWTIVHLVYVVNVRMHI